MELFKLLGTVAIDTAQAEKALDGVAKTAKTKSNEASEAFSKIGKAAGTIGKAVMTAGAEAVAPITVLQDYVKIAVRAENEGIRKTYIEQTGLLIDFLARTMPRQAVLDTGALVGALTPAVDYQLSDRWNHSKRGNTR